jgi:hypothetical protein
MPSEKSRYVSQNSEPSRIFEVEDFTNQLPSLGIDKLANILAVRSECDEILNKILSISLAFKNPAADIESVTKVLNYAIHITDNESNFVSDHDGHELILDEIFKQITLMAENGNIKLAKQVAKYTLEKGQRMLEKFEEGFCWGRALEKIESWLEN